MDVYEGDRVLVNLAPFIGSSLRCKVRIPCRVLAVDTTYVEVGTEHPFREVLLRVLPAWIEGKMESDQRQGGASNRAQSSAAKEVRRAKAVVAG
jgi:hypothetical protein